MLLVYSFRNVNPKKDLNKKYQYILLYILISTQIYLIITRSITDMIRISDELVVDEI